MREKLLNILNRYKRVVLGFSGGCDSSYLLYMCQQAGIDVLAVTFDTIMYPSSEMELAALTAQKLNANHRIIPFNPLAIPQLTSNPADRCYICKKKLFSILIELAKNEGYEEVFDGSNIDDIKDYRPGATALGELGVKSPLRESGFTKDMIRQGLKEAGLPQWSKPSFACYFSRFPYGMQVDENAVTQVKSAEEALHDLGLISARVRFHGDVARIEADKNDTFLCINDGNIRLAAIQAVKKAGFLYVAIDLEGYRTGSMNESLNLA